MSNAEAIELVSDYWMGQNRTGMTFSGFWIHRAKPIHWIIAALMAKVLEGTDAKEENQA